MTLNDNNSNQLESSSIIDHSDQAKTLKQKNTLIVFGDVGYKVCYLNISVEEALLRFKSNPLSEIWHPDYEIIEFDDEFNCYNVWGK